MSTITVNDLPALHGTTLGPGRWHEVTQEQINQFADATGDHQWIHVDPERAATGPFGRTIAHGYLVLSLLPMLLDELLRIDGATQAINYGLNKVRFPAPVPAGSSIRLTTAIADVEQLTPTGFRVLFAATIDCNAASKPACAAHVLCHYSGSAHAIQSRT